MAKDSLRRPQNAEGPFFVDETCIDCGTCWLLAPGHFHEDGGMSAVHAQPQDEAGRLKAFQALVSCPTASIGCLGDKQGAFEAMKSFPLELEDGVFYNGFASETSFGASSFFIKREGGNLLVDSPRVNGKLGARLDALGGARWMFLTHRDDVGEHQEWADRFGCARILHKDDNGPGRQMEIQPEGSAVLELAPDLKVIPVPGHTKGHCVLLYRDKFLFTGDHLEFDKEQGKLRAYKDYCWFDWKTQTESMRKLLDYEFEWVLPGHGQWVKVTRVEMKAMLKECVAWMESQIS
jgi:glyoxylase-like metal-dependent hydrolase (beta-lactamase superfamily II)